MSDDASSHDAFFQKCSDWESKSNDAWVADAKSFQKLRNCVTAVKQAETKGATRYAAVVNVGYLNANKQVYSYFITGVYLSFI